MIDRKGYDVPYKSIKEVDISIRFPSKNLWMPMRGIVIRNGQIT